MLSTSFHTHVLLIATSLIFGFSVRATAADADRGKEEKPAAAANEAESAPPEKGEEADGAGSPQKAPPTKLETNTGIDLPSAHKNVSIVLGAVVLNPFKLSQIEDPAAVRFQLDTGNTEANFLVEAGFRRRWAWLDRISPQQIARRQRELSAQIASLELAQPTNAQWVDLLSLQEAERRPPAAERTEQQERDAAAQAAKRQQEVQATADQRAKNLSELKKAKDELADLEARHGNLNAPGALSQPETSVFWPSSIWDQKGGWGFFIPDDWTTRLGFATGSETPSGAAALAGAGDFYIEQGLGWNLARFSMSNSVVGLDSRSDEAPFRGAFSAEVHTQFSNDPDLNDIHKRVLLGLSSSIGFALPTSRDESGPLKPAHIWEIVVRAGAVNVEIPVFLNSSTNEVEVRNQVPEFSGKWGFGLDAEFHIPVLEAGYLTLRGTMNTGFDPNPWTATVGYTLPIGDLLKLIRGS